VVLADRLGRDRAGGSGERTGPAGHLAVGDLVGLDVDGGCPVQQPPGGIEGDVDVAGGRALFLPAYGGEECCDVAGEKFGFLGGGEVAA
jgi:hypothetical protein